MNTDITETHFEELDTLEDSLNLKHPKEKNYIINDLHVLKELIDFKIEEIECKVNNPEE